MNIKRNGAALLVAATLMTGAASLRPPVAYAASTVQSQRITSCSKAGAAVALSSAQLSRIQAGDGDEDDVIGPICALAAACSMFWPIGTAMCGPTTIGCIIIAVS